MIKRVLWLVKTCLSSHISTCCMMEACNIMLICTLLFSIKGQTVQNSTVIPHTLCAHFTPVSLYTVLPCNCTVFTSKISTRELQVQQLCSISINHVSLCLSGELTTFTSVLSSKTSKSESCVGSWTPLRRRWRP